jgi:flagellar biosynthesis anti-sigma factor FlgM
MRINSDQGAQQLPDSGRTGIQNGVHNSNQTSGSSPATSTGSNSVGDLGQDHAQLSGGHMLVQTLAAQTAQLPEVREERVSALRQAIQSGSYHPSPADVAGAMFSQLTVERAA